MHSVPSSTPAVALSWDFGFLSMEYRVSLKKLMFIHYLLNLDKSSLANEIFCIQKEHNLPFFVKEGRSLLIFFSLPNIIDENIAFTKQHWKQSVKKVLNSKYEQTMASKILQYSKLKDGPLVKEKLEEKPYLSQMSLSDARTMLRIRSNMTNTEVNQQSDRENARLLWKCSECALSLPNSGKESPWIMMLI